MNSSLKFKTFQRQDLARGAMHDGLIPALDTGLGKSIYGFTFALLKTGWRIEDRGSKLAGTPSAILHPPASSGKYLRPLKPVLFIVPGDLHDQFAREGWEKLHIQCRPLDSQDAFQRLCRLPDSPLSNVDATGRPLIPPDFYLTSYTQLCTNNVARIPDPLDWDKPRDLLQWAGLLETTKIEDGRSKMANGQSPSAILHPPSSTPPDLIRDPHDDGRKLLKGDEPFLSARHVFTWRDRVWREEYDLLQVHRDDTRPDLDRAYEREAAKLAGWADAKAAANEGRKLDAAYQRLQNLFTYRPGPQYADLTLAQQDFVIREFLRRRFEAYHQCVGVTKEYPQGPLPEGYIEGKPETDTRPKWRVKCVYSPSLADLSYNAFDCVVIDEGVKMKGEDTYVGQGVRSMVAPFRCVLTATPIKNRLPDLFRLAWWATGGRAEAHARFPYRDDSSEREQFAKTFMVSECNLTKKKAEETKREGPRTTDHGPRTASRFTKLTAEICNVHRLWKLLAPIVLRRRKDECGEEIVPRLRKVVRVEMGTLQKQVVRYHLEAPYLDCNGMKAHGPQLTSLRIAACDPTAACLPNKGTVVVPCDCRNKQMEDGKSKMANTPSSCPRCGGTGKQVLPHVSGNPYTPKFAAVLTIVREILERGEQVLIGTTFNEAHDHLGGLLREAGVPFCLADGRLTPARRGPLMQRFRRGEWPVCLGGVESVANGHNLDTVNNVILYAYSWAYDLIKQFLDRVHRLTSKKPINVYVVFCHGTIDARLEALHGEKSSSVELALDGRLIGERSEDVNLAELLEIARDEFAASGHQSVDEAAIQRDWPQLRAQLATASSQWAVASGQWPVVSNQGSVISNQGSVISNQGSVISNQGSVSSGPLPSVAQASARPVRLIRPAPITPPMAVLAPDWRQQMQALAARLRGADLWDLL